MKKKFIGVWATFPFLDDMCDSIADLRKNGFEGITTHSPFPRHEITEALGNPQSRIPFFTIAGALTGGILAIFLIVMTTLDWILPVSEKPIVSIPVIFPVFFELSIIMAMEFSLLGMLFLIYRSYKKHNIPTSQHYLGYSRFMRDRFGVVVPCESDQIQKVEKVFKNYQAEEIYHET